LALPWCLVRDDRVNRRVEKERREPVDHRRQRLARTLREGGTVSGGYADRGQQLVVRDIEQKLPGRQVVVRTGVDPEEFGVATDPFHDIAVDGGAVAEDSFEHVAHLEVVYVSLVVIDVPTGERRLVEVPDQT